MDRRLASAESTLKIPASRASERPETGSTTSQDDLSSTVEEHRPDTPPKTAPLAATLPASRPQSNNTDDLLQGSKRRRSAKEVAEAAEAAERRKTQIAMQAKLRASMRKKELAASTVEKDQYGVPLRRLKHKAHRSVTPGDPKLVVYHEAADRDEVEIGAFLGDYRFRVARVRSVVKLQSVWRMWCAKRQLQEHRRLSTQRLWNHWAAWRHSFLCDRMYVNGLRYKALYSMRSYAKDQRRIRTGEALAVLLIHIFKGAKVHDLTRGLS